MKLFIGTSGFSYKDWKERFYPEKLPAKDQLSYYSKIFNSVEVNATFYRSFGREVFQNWKNKTPDDFTFTIKGSRFITHIKRINNVKEETERFFDSVKGLGNKLNLVLWQFPASFKATEHDREKLEDFFKLLPDKFRQAIEIRSDSWFTKDFFDLLRIYDIGFVVNSSGRYPEKEEITSNFAYFRFHGPASLYSSSYSDKHLEKYAVKIKNILHNSDVYCYFNNDSHAFAVKNALTLKKLVSES